MSVFTCVAMPICPCKCACSSIWSAVLYSTPVCNRFCHLTSNQMQYFTMGYTGMMVAALLDDCRGLISHCAQVHMCTESIALGMCNCMRALAIVVLQFMQWLCVLEQCCTCHNFIRMYWLNMGWHWLQTYWLIEGMGVWCTTSGYACTGVTNSTGWLWLIGWLMCGELCFTCLSFILILFDSGCFTDELFDCFDCDSSFTSQCDIMPGVKESLLSANWK